MMLDQYSNCGNSVILVRTKPKRDDYHTIKTSDVMQAKQQTATVIQRSEQVM